MFNWVLNTPLFTLQKPPKWAEHEFWLYALFLLKVLRNTSDFIKWVERPGHSLQGKTEWDRSEKNDLANATSVAFPYTSHFYGRFICLKSTKSSHWHLFVPNQQTLRNSQKWKKYRHTCIWKSEWFSSVR